MVSPIYPADEVPASNNSTTSESHEHAEDREPDEDPALENLVNNTQNYIPPLRRAILDAQVETDNLVESIEKLLAIGTDPNECDNQGNSAIILASQKGFLGVVKSLLANHVNPNISNEDNVNVLFAAMRYRQNHVVAELLSSRKFPLINTLILCDRVDNKLELPYIQWIIDTLQGLFHLHLPATTLQNETEAYTAFWQALSNSVYKNQFIDIRLNWRLVTVEAKDSLSTPIEELIRANRIENGAAIRQRAERIQANNNSPVNQNVTSPPPGLGFFAVDGIGSSFHHPILASSQSRSRFTDKSQSYPIGR